MPKKRWSWFLVTNLDGSVLEKKEHDLNHEEVIKRNKLLASSEIERV